MPGSLLKSNVGQKLVLEKISERLSGGGGR